MSTYNNGNNVFLNSAVVSVLNVFHPLAVAYSGPSQASKMELFPRIVNDFKLTLLNILKKVTLQMLKGILNTPITCSYPGNQLNMSKSMSIKISFDIIKCVNIIKILNLGWFSQQYLEFSVTFSFFTYSTKNLQI